MCEASDRLETQTPPLTCLPTTGKRKFQSFTPERDAPQQVCDTCGGSCESQLTSCAHSCSDKQTCASLTHNPQDTDHSANPVPQHLHTPMLAAAQDGKAALPEVVVPVTSGWNERYCNRWQQTRKQTAVQGGELGLLDVHLIGDAKTPEASTSMALTDLAHCRSASHFYACTGPH